jgi:hypothetical protein
MDTKSCFIMGLPEAGKTTYLAALWYCLSQPPGKTVLRLKNYSGNHTYLTKINEKWLDVERALRTNIHAEEKELTLILMDSLEQEYSVTFTDLSGESFQKQYIDREINKETAEYVRQCDGILLFVNPLTIQEPELISELSVSLRMSNDSNEFPPARNPLSDPTDVQLVELLQFVAFLRDNKQVRLGLVVSAWDTINKTQYDTPQDFIKNHLPLIWQYLNSNYELFDLFSYGVSALGGSLENLEEVNRLSSYDDPMERIIVVDNEHNSSNDITLLLWKALNKVGEQSNGSN